MAYLTSGNDEIIYDLLSRYNFTLVKDKIDDYKCVICQRILINAHQARCGCHYCQKCGDECVRGGAICCPGDTELCKTAPLSNVVINHRLNLQIAQLIVKCPEEMCHYEGQLRDMREHLRLCGKRNVDCPFIDLGCDKGKMRVDELNEHLQQESYRHSEILIGEIGNLRYEMKRDREKYDKTIYKLVKSDRENDVIIDLMREEMDLMKMEKATMEQRLDNLDNLLDGKGDKILEEIEVQLEEMIRERKGLMEQHQLAMENVEERNEKKYRREIAEEIDAVEKCLAEKIDADFVWTIENIAEKIQKEEWIYSDYFIGCVQPYKIRLCCYAEFDEFRIHFGIYGGDSDDSLPWPYVRNITIAITNRMCPNVHKSITKHCSIGRPITQELSKAFVIKCSELSNDDGELPDDCVTVECFICDGWMDE